MRIFSAIFCLCIFPSALFPQSGLGLLSSNYCGISTVNFNPAIADNHLWFDMNIGSYYLAGNNNYLGARQQGVLTGVFTPQMASPDVAGNYLFSTDSLTFSNGKKNFFYRYLQVQGPGSFMICFGKNKENAIGVSYNYNLIENFSSNKINIDSLLSPGPGIATGTSATGSFSMKSLSWIDFGITYSRVLLHTTHHLFKFGFTPKLTLSEGAVNIYANNVPYTSAGLTGNINYSLNDPSNNFLVSANGSMPNFGMIDGAGFAGDIGFVYEWRPKIEKYYYDMDGKTNLERPDKDLYTLRLAFSATDLGFVTVRSEYNDTMTNQPFSLNSDNSLANLFSQNQNVLKNSNVFRNNKYLLPMRFNFSLDYNIVGGFGLNLMARYAPVLPNNPYYLRHISDFAFTPRFDLKWFGAYVPFDYDLNSKFSIGVAFRFGPVFAGLDNLLLLPGYPSVFKAGIFLGAKIPLPYYLPKDRDHDKVSDKFDRCPDVPGTWKTYGCPDADSDGVADFEDSCPHQPGLAKNHGCPDRDGDGVIDKYDRCPDQPGPAALRGCPDRDSDGIADIDDSCPDLRGVLKYHGCPWKDTDYDGVPDSIDKCPTKKGLAIHHGCPDTDGDGVFDDSDACPNEPGPVENQGCPWGDADGDGILDNEDSCPFTFGVIKYHGCPAPPEKPKLGSMDMSISDVEFIQGSADITYSNQKRLDDVVKLAKDHPLNALKIIGYTDSLEMKDSELDSLSMARAVAVLNYLVDHGIEKLRIEYDGLGRESPVGDNSLASGREKNRRVEIFWHLATKN